MSTDKNNNHNDKDNNHGVKTPGARTGTNHEGKTSPSHGGKSGK